jgi:hypothetical protein
MVSVYAVHASTIDSIVKAAECLEFHNAFQSLLHGPILGDINRHTQGSEIRMSFDDGLLGRCQSLDVLVDEENASASCLGKGAGYCKSNPY